MEKQILTPVTPPRQEEQGSAAARFLTINAAYRELKRVLGRRRAARYLTIQDLVLTASVAAYREELEKARSLYDYEALRFNITELALAELQAHPDLLDDFDSETDALVTALQFTRLVLPGYLEVAPGSPARLIAC